MRKSLENDTFIVLFYYDHIWFKFLFIAHILYWRFHKNHQKSIPDQNVHFLKGSAWDLNISLTINMFLLSAKTTLFGAHNTHSPERTIHNKRTITYWHSNNHMCARLCLSNKHQLSFIYIAEWFKSAEVQTCKRGLLVEEFHHYFDPARK